MKENNFNLGLFEPSHMQYEIDRISAPNPNEPSLTEMTDFAVRMLQRNPKGYVLLVESEFFLHALGVEGFMLLLNHSRMKKLRSSSAKSPSLPYRVFLSRARLFQY